MVDLYKKSRVRVGAIRFDGGFISRVRVAVGAIWFEGGFIYKKVGLEWLLYGLRVDFLKTVG